MCKNLWYELNPQVRFAFCNFSMNMFVHSNLPASFAGPRHGRRQGKGLCYRLQFLISFHLNTIISNPKRGTVILTFKQHFTSEWCNYRRSSCLSRNCPVLSLLGYEGFNWDHKRYQISSLLFEIGRRTVQYRYHAAAGDDGDDGDGGDGANHEPRRARRVQDRESTKDFGFQNSPKISVHYINILWQGRQGLPALLWGQG